MSKRKIIIILIALLIIAVLVLGFYYLYKPSNTAPGNSTGTNFFSTLFPFIKKINQAGEGTNPANISGFKDNGQLNLLAPSLLVRVSSFPIAGYVSFAKEQFAELPTITSLFDLETTTAPTPVSPTTEFVSSLRYVEKTTGNIYETPANKIFEKKLSARIIPKIYEASFVGGGDTAILRYLNNDSQTIATFLSPLLKEILGGDLATPNNPQGSFLPENISDLSISPDTSKLFYLQKSNDKVFGIIADSSGQNKNQIFQSPFTEWLSWWPNDRMITLTTKPSYNVPGYMYALDPERKDFNKILGGINGLTTLTSPSGKLVLYASGSLNLNVFNIETKISSPLGVKTLPEKCVWNKTSELIYCAVPKYIPEENYPDSWYQGLVSFSDEFLKINITTGVESAVLDPTPLASEEIDGVKLGLDQNEKYLFFVNKKNPYLWEFSL